MNRIINPLRRKYEKLKLPAKSQFHFDEDDHDSLSKENLMAKSLMIIKTENHLCTKKYKNHKIENVSLNNIHQNSKASIEVDQEEAVSFNKKQIDLDQTVK